MRPLISEFSYGYSLTEEFAGGRFGKLEGFPVFPSLYEEGTSGGYDLKLPLKGFPIFIQFKLSDFLGRRNAKEWDLFNSNYYRMHLRPLRYSNQHNLLLNWESKGNSVYYTAPIFHRSSELNRFYGTNQVFDNSIFFKPSDIGRLPDEDAHYLVFDNRQYAFLFSKEPSQVRCLNKETFIEDIEKTSEGNYSEINYSYFENIVKNLRGTIETEIKEEDNINFLKIKLVDSESLNPIIKYLTYLLRCYLNSELIIFAQNSDEIGGDKN